MNEKQTQREPNRAAFEFEEECKHGKVSTSNITLREFCGEYLWIMKKILAPTTYALYKNNIDQSVIPVTGNRNQGNKYAYDSGLYTKDLREATEHKRKGAERNNITCNGKTVPCGAPIDLQACTQNGAYSREPRQGRTAVAIKPLQSPLQLLQLIVFLDHIISRYFTERKHFSLPDWRLSQKGRL